MPSLPDLLASGNAWLFIPSAILIGALHGLEPGHSKTMMAAFIIAVRGTVAQAVLLGVSAAISHSLVVWVVALGGQYLGQNLNAGTTEPYLQLASAVIVLGVGLWMIWRTRRDALGEAGHDHGHDHDHPHEGGHTDVRRIETGHGRVALEVFEDGVPPRWRMRTEQGQAWSASDVLVVTERPDRARQAFAFVDHGDYLESVDEIPEPHAFTARLSLGHGGHTHDYDLSFSEGHDHSGHDHEAGLKVGDGSYMDPHERAHASDIERRFSGRSVTTGQIMIFGLTGGLIPCPAAITVLMLCLQLKQFTLGVMLVLSFSFGLALTMVLVGVAASLSIRHIQKRWSGFGAFARRAPYASAGLMIAIALYMGVSGWIGLTGGHVPQI
ncbi:MAG: nickel/cobalt efflux transporter [Sphingomonas sp.]|jgi:nickel/cobalt exporter|uniref:nickel/cobalt efflux transporter n=1 Tax=Sphingomonas sp. TaxID=28214 RepID=UPI00356AC392